MLGGGTGSGEAEVEAFIARWRASEGAERAAYAQFLNEFCDLVRVGRPQPPTRDAEAVSYRFEYPVRFPDPSGTYSIGRIDLYKKAAFVLEAKQSRWKGQAKEVLSARGGSLEGEPESLGPRGRRGADRAWDVLMLNARRQAEDYAKALPAAHGWPPFLIICDVGHCFEFYADFTGQGKNYVQFPDRQRYRVHLDDLREPSVRERIARIWTEPFSLDPAREAARVTRGIAERLAAVSKTLERKHDPEEVALFLMRCLFTMFAEDVQLIATDSFKTLLSDCSQKPEAFVPLVSELWNAMDKGEYSTAIREQMKRFNGKLYEDAKVFPLGREEIGELLAAPKHDWKEVEPAIFGTLLEQALDQPSGRRLGAHYTPRAYVERLVVETVIAPAARGLARGSGRGAAGCATAAIPGRPWRWSRLSRRTVPHARARPGLRNRELPACRAGADEEAGRRGARRRRRTRQPESWAAFADIPSARTSSSAWRLNPRAVAIADLVLWIGHLQWHFKHARLRAARTDPRKARPYLQARRGAVLGRLADPAMEGWSGEALPNPRRPNGRRPSSSSAIRRFIGGKDLRARLTAGLCAGAVGRASADERERRSGDVLVGSGGGAADAGKAPKLRRFGFVTTNSITQVFQRRSVERHLSRQADLLLIAIPDHPWTKAGREAAAVRIAMTVVSAGTHDGKLCEVVAESGLDGDQPQIELSESAGGSMRT
jgi:hypothetical protein